MDSVRFRSWRARTSDTEDGDWRFREHQGIARKTEPALHIQRFSRVGFLLPSPPRRKKQRGEAPSAKVPHPEVVSRRFTSWRRSQEFGMSAPSTGEPGDAYRVPARR
jgi:hypothetical protein